MLRKEIIAKEQPYHIVSQAVEKREIFHKKEDCFRAIFQMYAANIGKPAPNLYRKDIVKAGLALLNGEEIFKDLIIAQHSPLVYCLSFVYVFDHEHLLLVPAVKNGISKYIHNYHLGFAKYYNLKYERNGNLFRRPYKIIPIQTDFQLDAVLRYINVINVLDVFQPGWREKGLKDKKAAFRFLNNYQFSTFPDLFGKRNSKILAPKKILEKYLGREIIFNQNEFLNYIKDFLHQKSMFNSLFFGE